MDKITQAAIEDLRDRAREYQARGHIGCASVCLDAAERLEDEWNKDNERFLTLMENIKNAEPGTPHPIDDERPGY